MGRGLPLRELSRALNGVGSHNGEIGERTYIRYRVLSFHSSFLSRRMQWLSLFVRGHPLSAAIQQFHLFGSKRGGTG